MAISLSVLRNEASAVATDNNEVSSPLDYISLFSKEDQMALLCSTPEGVELWQAIKDAEALLQQAKIAASGPAKEELEASISRFLQQNGDFLYEGMSFTFAEAVTERTALYTEGKSNARKSSTRLSKMVQYTKQGQERFLGKEDAALLEALEAYLKPFNGIPAGHLIAAAPSSKSVAI